MPGLMWPHLRQPRELDAMVEVQARLWTLKQHGRSEPVARKWPVVTISREAGEPERVLGRSLAERLGFSYWDRALVLELAHLMNADSAPVSMLGTRPREAIEAFLGESVPNGRVIALDYVDQIHLVVDSIVSRGGAVLVGQGAQLLVVPRHALRVRMVAPVSRGPLDDDFGDPADFDVAINSGTYERERAVGLVLMAYLAKFGDWPTTAPPLLPGQRTGPVPALPPRTPPGRS